MQPSRSFATDKADADRFLPEARRVLANYFIRLATVSEDQDEATDLVIFSIGAITLAWRNRTNRVKDYLALYPNDITIRNSRPSGATTEYLKVMSGYASHMLYSFGDHASRRILAYRIIDLDAFRKQEMSANRAKYSICKNDDGVTFRAYDTRTFTPGVILHAGQRAGRPGIANCGAR